MSNYFDLLLVVAMETAAVNYNSKNVVISENETVSVLTKVQLGTGNLFMPSCHFCFLRYFESTLRMWHDRVTLGCRTRHKESLI